MADQKVARTPVLDIAYLDDGPAAATPVVLCHGFPYSVHAFDEVTPLLNAAGFRTVVPHLRGFGATRFLSQTTPRSGQQGAIGQDLLDLLDALSISRAIVAGFDWGGRAACVAAALRPERIVGLVSATGYLIQDIANATRPADPQQEWRFWYQWYFNTERGRNGLARNRGKLTRVLWNLWSPNWQFDDAALARTVAAFENPDFVDIVIHSYRHRSANAAGDPSYDAIESSLAKLPAIGVPTIAIQGTADGVNPPAREDRNAARFTGSYERRLLERVGHNPPQEAPQAFAQAIIDVSNHA